MIMANQVPSEVVETLYQIAGGDYAGVIGRLRTNERIAKFVTMFADDASYTNLIDNMATENWDEAFRAAHTLKVRHATWGSSIFPTARAKLLKHCARAMPQRPKSSCLL